MSNWAYRTVKANWNVEPGPSKYHLTWIFWSCFPSRDGLEPLKPSVANVSCNCVLTLSIVCCPGVECFQREVCFHTHSAARPVYCCQWVARPGLVSLAVVVFATLFISIGCAVPLTLCVHSSPRVFDSSGLWMSDTIINGLSQSILEFFWKFFQSEFLSQVIFSSPGV
jgi:hypothetical protein